jgi:3-dehydrosphinganine reductase
VTRLRDAHVIVTGGSMGIGRAVAAAAAGRGARVSIIARGEEQLRTAAAELGAAWRRADVTDEAALRTAIDELTGEQGPCDVMVTSAGFAHPGYSWELPTEVFRTQMEVNYLGTVHAIWAVLPSMMQRRRGHLVVISSDVGLFGVYGYTAYAPTKFAVRGLAESLRGEVAPYGIGVSIAYPPDTETPGFDAENRIKPPETARISASIRPRSAQQVADAIVTGIERDRLTITADPTTAFLARGIGIVGPVVRAMMDRDVRRVQAGVR